MLYPKLTDTDVEILVTKLAFEFFQKNTLREINSMLASVLTEKELQHVAVRLEIAKKLIKRIPQRNIAVSTGVGIATVTSVSKVINSGGYQWLLPKS